MILLNSQAEQSCEPYIGGNLFFPGVRNEAIAESLDFDVALTGSWYH